MIQADTTTSHQRIIDTAIRLTLLALLVFSCFHILSPLLVPVLWGTIIAIGTQPLFERGVRMLGDRRKTAAVLFALIGLAALIIPSIMLADSAIKATVSLHDDLQRGDIVVPPPSDQVKDWPLVGSQVHEVWTQASNGLEDALKQWAPHLRGLMDDLLATVRGLGMGILGIAFAILIASVFLANSSGIRRSVDRIAERLVPQHGAALIDLSRDTISSVVQGVLGVAIIQALLAGAGMLAAGVPGAGLWTIAILVLAVAQLPATLVLIPVVIYVFSANTTVVAVAFLVWSILVGLSDNLLKPLLLGRGVDAPMFVILLGSISGMIAYGIIGLFFGATMLAVGYKLFIAWIELEFPGGAEAPASS